MRYPEPGQRRRGPRRPPSYYGVPPIHKPHWKWLIISYFFLGGLSGGSYVVASFAELFGRGEHRDVTRVGRYLSLLTIIPCPILLTLDLGRPERFLHMLRVFKLRSPMSLGTWCLVGFSGFSALSAAVQAVHDGRLRGSAAALRSLPSRLVGTIGAALGFFLSGYTGVLLGATAVPVWAKNARLLGPLFLTSGIASACAAISLVLALLPGRRSHSLERLRLAETFAGTSELALLGAMHLISGQLRAPLTQGPLAKLHLVGSIGLGVVGPVGVHLLGRALGAPHRLVTIVAATMSLIGGYIVKYTIVMAGHASADDPAATFEFAGGALPEHPSEVDAERRQ